MPITPDQLAAFMPNLRRYAKSFDGPNHEDLAQAAAERIWSRREQFVQGGDAEARKWMMSVARTVCLDAVRAWDPLRYAKPLPGESAGGEDGPDGAVYLIDDRMGVPPRAEDIIYAKEICAAALRRANGPLLLYVAGEQKGNIFADAARLFGVCEGTVGSRLNRARADLRRFAEVA